MYDSMNLLYIEYEYYLYCSQHNGVPSTEKETCSGNWNTQQCKNKPNSTLYLLCYIVWVFTLITSIIAITQKCWSAFLMMKSWKCWCHTIILEMLSILGRYLYCIWIQYNHPICRKTIRCSIIIWNNLPLF